MIWVDYNKTPTSWMELYFHQQKELGDTLKRNAMVPKQAAPAKTGWKTGPVYRYTPPLRGTPRPKTKAKQKKKTTLGRIIWALEWAWYIFGFILTVGGVFITVSFPFIVMQHSP